MRWRCSPGTWRRFSAGGRPAGRPESFAVVFPPGVSEQAPPVMRVIRCDDLGLVYGLLHVSRAYLGIDPFWFWADRPSERRAFVGIPAEDYVSPEPRVRYRGWFVNDEVCLIGWTA